MNRNTEYVRELLYVIVYSVLRTRVLGVPMPYTRFRLTFIVLPQFVCYMVCIALQPTKAERKCIRRERQMLDFGRLSTCLPSCSKADLHQNWSLHLKNTHMHVYKSLLGVIERYVWLITGLTFHSHWFQSIPDNQHWYVQYRIDYSSSSLLSGNCVLCAVLISSCMKR